MKFHFLFALFLYVSLVLWSGLSPSPTVVADSQLIHCLTKDNIPAFSYYEPGRPVLPLPPREFEPGAQLTPLDRAYLHIQDLVSDAYNGASRATLSAALDEIIATLPMDKDERDPIERLQLRCNPRIILRGLGTR